MFISPVYGGRCSDKFITAYSGFLEYLHPGDEVMADRCCTITNLLYERKVKLVIPAFTKRGMQLSEENTTNTTRIAKKSRDILPSMVTHTRNLCSAINPSKVHTHSSEHTHTVNTHPEQWAAIYAAAPGEQLGVRCLAQGHLSRDIEGGESAVHSLPPPTIPAGPRLEPATFGLRVRL